LFAEVQQRDDFLLAEGFLADLKQQLLVKAD